MTPGRGAVAVGLLALGATAGTLVTRQLASQPVAAPAVQPLPGRDWQSFAPVVKRVLPAVVCLEGKGRPKRAAGEDTDPGFGSGVLIDAAGVILTNNHVVADLEQVEVTLHDGRKFLTADIRRDPKTDLAVVKADAKDLPFLEFGDSDQM
ncbi:MAG: S1C family serine protease, partial [Gemmataceae bacterium]|nr:S1C family serine protease [Gemmataceae bacterium]